MNRCYVGVGANLGKPLATFRWLHARLKSTRTFQKLAFSPIYASAPVGPGRQNDFLNAVLTFESALEPAELLGQLLALESLAGRVRNDVRWGPRTLDLDLLLVGTLEVQSSNLQVPHPRLEERNFVLQPLIDLLGGAWRLPNGNSLQECLERCADNRLERTDLSWEPQTLSNSDSAARDAL
ncbi:MAG: 2-amino-4-hydroxy-6-hydroxymethyldihydropteridine diphosphokinase [Pseudomonadota bacterium]